MYASVGQYQSVGLMEKAAYFVFRLVEKAAVKPRKSPGVLSPVLDAN